MGGRCLSPVRMVVTTDLIALTYALEWMRNWVKKFPLLLKEGKCIKHISNVLHSLFILNSLLNLLILPHQAHCYWGKRLVPWRKNP
jgi:hypothetical protein